MTRRKPTHAFGVPKYERLVLEVIPLLLDPLWIALEPEGRGVLLSLWVACARFGGIPMEPTAAARLAMLDNEPMAFWWPHLRHWFVPHAELDLLVAPVLGRGFDGQERRSKAASFAASRARAPRLGPTREEQLAEAKLGSLKFQIASLRAEKKGLTLRARNLEPTLPEPASDPDPQTSPDPFAPSPSPPTSLHQLKT